MNTKALTYYAVVDDQDRLLPSPAHPTIVQFYTTPEAAQARLSNSGHRVAMICAVVLSPVAGPPPAPPPAAPQRDDTPQPQKEEPPKSPKPAKKAKLPRRRKGRP